MSYSQQKFIRSRKGVSGAISGVFLVTLFFLAMGAIYIYATNLDRYNQVVIERSESDSEIIAEKFQILEGRRNNDGSLNLTILNYGSELAQIVDVWVTLRNENGSFQKLYQTSYWINPAETIYNFGEQSVTELPNGLDQNCINLTQPLAPNKINYTVKIVSSRGNSASYMIAYQLPENGGGGGFYSLTIVESSDNFQYAQKDNMTFKIAYAKPRSTDRTLYRVLLNNTTEDRIFFHNNCSLLQKCFAGGAEQHRYIVSNLSDTNNANPTEFSSQVIEPATAQYIYFAGDAISTPSWQPEPDKKEYYQVGVLIFFIFEGETEVRSIGLPVLTQELQ